MTNRVNFTTFKAVFPNLFWVATHFYNGQITLPYLHKKPFNGVKKTLFKIDFSEYNSDLIFNIMYLHQGSGGNEGGLKLSFTGVGGIFSQERNCHPFCPPFKWWLGYHHLLSFLSWWQWCMAEVKRGQDCFRGRLFPPPSSVAVLACRPCLLLLPIPVPLPASQQVTTVVVVQSEGNVSPSPKSLGDLTENTRGLQPTGWEPVI